MKDRLGLYFFVSLLFT